MMTATPVLGTATVIRPQQRPLFGLYHPPQGPMHDTALVLCPPLGYESLVTYRTYRHLAERLAAQGFAVLRFDYFGTGNSAGQPDQAGDLRGDVHAAIEHLKHLTGLPTVTVAGVRAGALLAAAVAADRTDVTNLIVMAVPAAGRLLVRELKAFQALSAVTEAELPGDGSLSLVGFDYPAALLAELAAINLLTTDFSALRRVLILSRDDLNDDDKLLNRWLDAGCQVRKVAVKGYAAMMTTTETSEVPGRWLAQIQEWLLLHSPPTGQPTPTPPAAEPLRCEFAGVALTEQTVRFGPEGSLFGVMTEQQREVERRARHAVLLLNVGTNHHIGSGRLYVTLARELAAQGVVAFRFDMSGLGESQPRPGKPENLIYDPDTLNDVTHAMAVLSKVHQVEGFILAGICLGAHLAFYAPPVKKQVVGRLLVNWSVFDLIQPMPAAVSAQYSFRSRHYYLRALFDPATWRRVFRGEVASLAIGKHLLRQLQRLGLVNLKRRLLFWRVASHGTNPVERKMKTILRAGVPTWLVYSDGDPALDALQAYLGKDAAWVRHFEHFDMRTVNDADHAFTRPGAQRELRRLLLEFVAQVNPRRRGRAQRGVTTTPLSTPDRP